MPQTEAQARWYQENKEYCRAKTARFRALNPEKNKEYYRNNIDKFKKRYEENKEELLVISKRNREIFRQKYPERYLLRSAKARAKERGLEFNITEEDIPIPEFCPVLGIKICLTNKDGGKDDSPNIDRFDNTKGYIKGNVSVISGKANRIKTDATTEEIKKVVEWMESRVGS